MLNDKPKEYLKTWSERRAVRSARERYEDMMEAASHLPVPSAPPFVSDDDMDALKAAFTMRFDEDLPRTETLMSVANIGYRMALRDMKKG